MSYFNTLLISVFTIFFTSCEKIGNTSQRGEEERLKNLYKEINELATSITCDNAEEWDFTPIGSKACGGPTGYIAYSSKIDTEDFLEKVALYTELQDQYNRKWRIVSDCMAILPPDDIKCVDGKPKFIYEYFMAN